ncbi:MAG: TldD/PmbA family protein [Thermoleophilaceae bacterium]
MSSVRDLAGRAVAAVRAGDGALATVTRERSLLLRFARSRPTQATSVEDTGVTISVLVDGHVGSATTNRGDDEGLRECARAAETSAGAAARTRGSGSYPGFPLPHGVRAHHGFDERTARLDPAPGGRALATAFEVAAANGVEAHGIWTEGDVETAIAFSSGELVVDRVTDAFMKVTCFAPGGRSGWASRTAVTGSRLDAGALAQTAAAKATGTVAGRPEPIKLPPGDYPVVLAPAAVGELVDWLGWTAFNGLAHAEGRGALVGRMGERVVAPSVNISDSPRFVRTLPRAFDAEGVTKSPIALIQDGVAHRVVYDTRSAALAGDGAVTTGHAIEPGGSSWGAFPTNLVMIGGGAADERELCAPIDRGVYVTRLWYTNALRPNETLITGVTRDGTFLIEDGEIAAPLEDLRLTDSVLRILSGTQALTRTQELWSEGEFYGRRFASGVVVPAIRAASVRFTGGA